MLVALKRIIKLGWQGFTRDGGVIVATCFILVLTICLISSLFLLGKVSQILISRLEEKVDISVYFKEEVSDEKILDVKEAIAQIPEVKEVGYTSREKALEEFIERHKEDPVLMKSLEEVGTNPFLASLNIKASDPSDYRAIADFLENSPFSYLIEKIDFYQRKAVIERIFTLTSSFKKFLFSFSIILAFTSFLVVLNTIRLAILNSSEEIKIQKLVGASNFFIRGPFLVQGVICGFFSALIAFLILSGACWFLSPKIEILFSDLSLWSVFRAHLFEILLIQVISGILLASVSSTIAVRKYLEI